jgi:hypothetical protein
MGNVVELNKYRSRKKRSFLEKHQPLLKQFIEGFVHQHFKMSFAVVNAQYLAQRAMENETAWDYYDFREELKEAISKVYGTLIWQEIQRMPWFDKNCISPEDLIEQCMLYYILGETPAANR